MTVANLDEAIELAAGAGDRRISGVGGIGRPATVSDERLLQVRQIIKRFCKHLDADCTVGEILDELDN